MQKLLIILGITIFIIGLAWPFIRKLGLGHLPGDIIIRKGGMTFYFPIVTCIIISILISLLITIIWWLMK